jgi:hypothetical protein
MCRTYLLELAAQGWIVVVAVTVVSVVEFLAAITRTQQNMSK